MTKVNVNSASREELVDVAGLRPALAEMIVKHREENGRISGIDALADLRGVGAATMDQLKDVLAFGAEKAKETAHGNGAQPMAKVNVNSASHEELVEVAGLRPALAEAIVKHREENGRISGVDALADLRGVGAATMDQLKDVLAFGAEKAKETAEKAKETGEKAAEATTSAVRAGAEAATKVGVEATRRVADKGAEVTSIAARNSAEMAHRSAEVAQRGVEAAQRATADFAKVEKAVAERSAGTAKDLGQLVVSLMSEQVQANAETLQALARARTWREAVEVQNDYVRGNVERATQGASRYVETVTKLMTGMVRVGQERARKAA